MKPEGTHSDQDRKMEKEVSMVKVSQVDYARMAKLRDLSKKSSESEVVEAVSKFDKEINKTGHLSEASWQEVDRLLEKFTGLE